MPTQVLIDLEALAAAVGPRGSLNEGTVCGFPECAKPAHCRLLCVKHHSAWRYHLTDWGRAEQRRRRERYEANKAAEAVKRRAARAANLERFREYDRKRARQSVWINRRAEIGRCERCGYDEFVAALDWHHREPKRDAKADFRKLKGEAAEAEIRKCVLLCANCHRGVHAGVWSLFELEDRSA